MDWFIKRLNSANTSLDYWDYFNYKDDFEKLLKLNIIKYSQQIDELPCEWCEEEHFITPLLNREKQLILTCFGNARIVNVNELKVWTINRDVLAENVNSENRIIDKSSFEKTVFASQNTTNKNDLLCYITKNSNGDYLFEGNLVYIKNKNADYVVIFDVAYSLKPQGGKIQYAEIIKLCKKRKKEITKSSVLRALTGKDANLFKYVKGIRQEPKYGISLFVAMQDGKEIEFNNKK